MTIFTKEQMIEAQRKSAEKREAGKALYRTDFLDDEYWKELAREFNVTLPQWHIAPEKPKMRSWVRRLGINERNYKDACGDGWQYDDFAILNPDWPLRAFVGILLEYAHELKLANEINKKHTNRL